MVNTVHVQQTDAEKAELEEITKIDVCVHDDRTLYFAAACGSILVASNPVYDMTKFESRVYAQGNGAEPPRFTQAKADVAKTIYALRRVPTARFTPKVPTGPYVTCQGFTLVPACLALMGAARGTADPLPEDVVAELRAWLQMRLASWSSYENQPIATGNFDDAVRHMLIATLASDYRGFAPPQTFTVSAGEPS